MRRCDPFLDIVYALALPLFLRRMLFDPAYRRHLSERLGRIAAPPKRRKKRIWLHAASVGEILASREFARRATALWPEAEFLFSTNTPAGRDILRRDFPDAFSFYAPLDFSFSVEEALKNVRPDLMILVEGEIWPRVLRSAEQRGIPVAAINGRMTERSCRRYRRLRWLFSGPLRSIRLFAVQEKQYRDRLLRLGVDPSRIAVTGNMKEDLLCREEGERAALDRHFRQLFGLAPDDPLIVAGSTHDPEESVILRVFKTLKREHPALCLLLAPRHLVRVGEVEKMVEAEGLSCYKRTFFDAQRPPEKRDVILLDTIGELSRLYAAATLVFVGGSLVPKGGQNMMEPGAMGRPVLMGISTHNFREIAGRMETAGGLVAVRDEADLTAAARRILADGATARRMGEANRDIFRNQGGATEKNLDLVERILLKGDE